MVWVSLGVLRFNRDSALQGFRLRQSLFRLWIVGSFDVCSMADGVTGVLGESEDVGIAGVAGVEGCPVDDRALRTRCLTRERNTEEK